MALALHQEEKEVIEAIIWFANLKWITSTAQIEKRFMQLSLVKDYFKVIKAHEVDAFRYDQLELRKWMSEIIASEQGKQRIAEKVSERMVTVGGAELVFKNRQFNYQFKLHGVQAVCALGLALILDKKRNLTTRLKQCGNPNCLRFNLELNPKGRPNRHCNSACKKLYDNSTAAERVKRHRDKMKR